MEGNQVNQQGATNAYQYNGKELNTDFGLDWLDYGTRWYDASIGRFHVIDRFAEKYYDLGSYHYVANNPMNAIDINGDSIWTTSSKEYVNEHGVKQINHTIHMTIALFDISDADIDIEKIRKGLIKGLKDALTMTYRDGGVLTSVTADIQIKTVESMDEVKETDHLLTLVDNGKGKTESGGQLTGKAKIGGQIAYVVTGKWWGTRSEESITSTGIHELGHNLGLEHSWNDGLVDTGGKESSNYMSYGKNRNEFSQTQIKYILSNTGALGSSNSKATNTLNQGLNYEYAKRSVSAQPIYNYSSNHNPWDKSVKKGEKIPKIIK